MAFGKCHSFIEGQWDNNWMIPKWIRVFHNVCPETFVKYCPFTTSVLSVAIRFKRADHTCLSCADPTVLFW